jgi:hypothetical protein
VDSPERLSTACPLSRRRAWMQRGPVALRDTAGRSGASKCRVFDSWSCPRECPLLHTGRHSDNPSCQFRHNPRLPLSPSSTSTYIPIYTLLPLTYHLLHTSLLASLHIYSASTPTEQYQHLLPATIGQPVPAGVMFLTGFPWCQRPTTEQQ